MFGRSPPSNPFWAGTLRPCQVRNEPAVILAEEMKSAKGHHTLFHSTKRDRG
jgi:hypothetical protein